MRIDLNCDLGEGAAFDAELMPLVTSANVCCGAHAGGPDDSLAALRLAVAHGVRVGAHPGYPDREHFGRREMDWDMTRLIDEVANQVRTLQRLAGEVGAGVEYLKPHGALYNQACRDEAVAGAVAEVGERLGLPIMGLPGSCLEAASGRFIAEGFADRRYREDGSLVPRSQADAFVHSPAEAVEQAKRLIAAGRIRTLCVHGDNPEAVVFVVALRAALLGAGFSIRAFDLP
jgi:5-oxoprolinase (ATP-hydrolysing) subunit A